MKSWIIGRDTPDTVLKYIHAETDAKSKQLLVCFDYFDTIVTRCIEPEHTKRLASGLLSRLLKGRFTGEALYCFRREIEHDLCLTNSQINSEFEFCFEDLGTNLWNQLTKNDDKSVLPDFDSFILDLLAIEVAVEKAVQCVCPEVLQVLQALHRLGYTLLLASDFYLPEKEFREMLSWHRLEHLFAEVYVSSAHGRSKGSGRMYPMICERHGVEPGQLLMIGDNPHADIQMSTQVGLQNIFLQRPDRNKMAPVQKKAENKKSPDQNAIFQKVALPRDAHFPEIGISFWLFTHRLFEELHQYDVRNVFFLSKEGEFLKNIFDQYQIALFGRIKIISHYLLASRKATFVASLRSLDNEDFSRLLDHYRDISIRDFLQSLNLENDAIGLICEKMSCNCDLRLSGLRHQPAFGELLGLKSFSDAFEKRRKDQKVNFIAYLDSFGVDYRREGLHIVDVGWKGSIQDNIYYILSAEIPVQGYYVGSLNATERVTGNRKKGLLFDNSPHPSHYFNVYNCNRSLYEIVLGASHGSADSYRSLDALQKSDCLSGNVSDKAVCGSLHPLVLTYDQTEEQQLFEGHIKPLQQKILNHTSMMNVEYIIHGMIPTAEWFARQHARMVFRPKTAEIEWFEALYHLENFGIFEFTQFDTAHNFSLLERLRNLKNIIRDQAVLESGIWPPIILRRFGVGFWQRADGLRRYFREFQTFS
ncbi:MAG: HAD family hydrolase [Proteobacteria bacterium]|nr:HAD family hydrolase [Pseudomonadota bacterium]